MNERRHYFKEFTIVCPITGKTTDEAWTDHALPGCYNSCEHCNDKTKPLAQSLYELNEKRSCK